MDKVITLKELEEQLSLAKDRVFVVKYYKMEADLESLRNQNESLRQEISRLRATAAKKFMHSGVTLLELEKEYILHTIKVVNGNKSEAATVLGITVKSLYNKLHAYGEF